MPAQDIHKTKYPHFWQPFLWPEQTRSLLAMGPFVSISVQHAGSAQPVETMPVSTIIFGGVFISIHPIG